MKSLLTFIYMGRMFRDEDLDGLVLTSYCAGLSAYNPIEHFWAHLSKQLSGAVLDAKFFYGALRPQKKRVDISQM